MAPPARLTRASHGRPRGSLTAEAARFGASLSSKSSDTLFRRRAMNGFLRAKCARPCPPRITAPCFKTRALGKPIATGAELSS